MLSLPAQPFLNRVDFYSLRLPSSKIKTRGDGESGIVINWGWAVYYPFFPLIIRHSSLMLRHFPQPPSPRPWPLFFDILNGMSIDPTQIQDSQERLISREISLKRGHPPTQVPGYEPERFLGAGAYGEVWVAIERNTGRRVAIKYYSHRGGLDWSLLSREVEKLAFLFADRYVVQLLGVGWDAEPPYYIMEYLEPGSLADRLQQGPMPVDKAVELFRDIAVGLVHAHGKGVLHCDLKPANILLDQDNKPRLADFGQSRLSHEQMPALGTMFYMAPEQADLEAMPDARWDVYALGALLYCMLTGHPPHRSGPTVDQFERTPDLNQRLFEIQANDRAVAAAGRALQSAGRGYAVGRNCRSLPGRRSRPAFSQRAVGARCAWTTARSAGRGGR